MSDIPPMMSAMVLKEFGRLVPRELPTPDPAADEVLVRVEVCGVCRTDLKILHGDHPDVPAARLPHVLGHEITGHVVAAGAAAEVPAEVRAEVPAAGGRVVVPLSLTCGECAQCRRGADQFCAAMRGRPGFTVAGGFAEYIAVPARSVVPVPAHVPAASAALLPDCISTAWHAMRRGRVVAGDRAVVLGAGGLGLHAVQFLVNAGAHVVAVEPDAAKRDLAVRLGASGALDSAAGTDDDVLRDDLRRLLGERDEHEPSPADIVLDFVGDGSSGTRATGWLAPGGRLLLVGYQAGTEVRLETVAAVSSELQVIGCRASTLADLDEATLMLAEGKVRAMIGRTYPFAAASDALADLAAGDVLGRAIVEVGGPVDLRYGFGYYGPPAAAHPHDRTQERCGASRRGRPATRARTSSPPARSNVAGAHKRHHAPPQRARTSRRPTPPGVMVDNQPAVAVPLPWKSTRPFDPAGRSWS
ncbi:MAG: alcohol dehydrogenase catalytic domain-containing protein [Streptosporangiales bacterium]|nr:alcohol dehydrogenase catalytic domain-containing protein [Streptosporangiales bacterium]